MFQFKRELILPVFLASGLKVWQLAKLAGVAHGTAYRAVNGLSVSAPNAAKIARALKIDVLKFLVVPAQM